MGTNYRGCAVAKTTEAEILGRVLAMETLVMTLIVHVAMHTKDPSKFTTQVMGSAGDLLKGMAAGAPKDVRHTARAAMESFAALSQQVVPMLTGAAGPRAPS